MDVALKYAGFLQGLGLLNLEPVLACVVSAGAAAPRLQ